MKVGQQAVDGLVTQQSQMQNPIEQEVLQQVINHCQDLVTKTVDPYKVVIEASGSIGVDSEGRIIGGHSNISATITQ